MIEALKKIASLAMALLVLFSTMSFTVNKHFCGSVLVDQAIFLQAESCGMDSESRDSEVEDHCCSEHEISVEGQKELKLSFDQLELPQQVFLAGFSYSYLQLFEGEPQQKLSTVQYEPPLLVFDLQLLDQTFLI